MTPHDIATIQNIATNGRWFCAMLFILALWTNHPRLALLAAIPVGAAVIVEQIQDERIAMWFATGIYALAVFAALLLLVNIG